MVSDVSVGGGASAGSAPPAVAQLASSTPSLSRFSLVVGSGAVAPLRARVGRYESYFETSLTGNSLTFPTASGLV